jgi:hypothetical protein
MSESGAPAKHAGIIVCSSEPMEAETLERTLRSDPAVWGALQNRAVPIDVVPVTADPVSLIDTLMRGYNGFPHPILFLQGAGVAGWKRKDLEEVFNRGPRRHAIVVVGLASRSEEIVRLRDEIGITDIVESVSPPGMILQAMSNANATAQARSASKAPAAAKSQAATVFEIRHDAPETGLLPHGGLISVHSVKGGTGKSTIASNIAWAMGQSVRPTALIDMNIDGGLMQEFFGRYLKEMGYKEPEEVFEGGQYGILPLLREYARSGKNLTATETLNNFIQMRLEKGKILSYLPGLPTGQHVARSGGVIAELTDRESQWFVKLMQVLQRQYHWVVADTGTNQANSVFSNVLRETRLLVWVLNGESEHSLKGDLIGMASALSIDADGRTTARIAPDMRIVVVVNRLAQPGGTDPFAPRFEQVKPEIEKLLKGRDPRLIKTLWIHDCGRAFNHARRTGKPLIGMADGGETLTDEEKRAVVEMKNVVNAIAEIYRSDGVQAAPSTIKKLFGR